MLSRPWIKFSDYIVSFLVALMFGYFAYLLSHMWTKKIEDSYNNLEEFSEMFSHEVLTPVSSALFYIKDEEVRQSLLKAKDFLNNFLNFQKYKLFPWKKELIDIDSILSIIEREISYITKERNIEIVKEINAKNIVSNREFVYFILKNIMENAAKFSNRDAQLKIFIKKYNRAIQITIQNYTEEKIVMDEKFQSKGGYGLGLYIVRKMLDNINGSIKFDSSESGKMTVVITIPQ
jgi:signal transduction histidine kinase